HKIYNLSLHDALPILHVKIKMKKVTNYLKTAALAIALLASSAAYAVTGAPVQGSANLKGKALMDKSDCNACHQLEVKVVGPAFKDRKSTRLNSSHVAI